MIKRTILLALLLFPLGSWALGLNDVTVNSFLNEKLDARIELTSASPGMIDDIRVALANPAAFEVMGVDRPFQLSKLRFKVQTGTDRRPYIQISSKGSIQEPFLDFLIEVNWPGGKLVRQYTLLLDPRTYAPTLSPAPDRPAVSSPATSRPRASASPSQSRTYGPVRSSDTLWVIAEKTRPDSSVTIQQMMMALQRRNPSAFSKGNVNLLRKDAVLAIPGRDVIGEMTPQEAREAFREQTRQWKAMREGSQREASAPGVRVKPETTAPVGSPKAQSPEMPPDPMDDRQPDAAGDAAKPPVVDQVPSEGRQLRVVETTKQDYPAIEDFGTKAAPPGNERLKRAIANSQDDLNSVKEINQDLDELRAVLEKKIEALRKSLEEKNQAIEDLQQELKHPAVALKSTGGSGGESIVAPDRKGAPADVVTEVEAPRQPEKVQTPMEKEEPAAPESLIEQYWRHLALAGISVALVLILVAIRRAKRRAESYSEEDTQFPDAYIELDDSPTPEAEVETPRVLSRQSADEIDAPDEPRDLRIQEEDDELFNDLGVDISGALSEADVYLAYHRYGRAESLIKDAIQDNPESMMLKAKLLEIYAFRKDKKQFTSFMEQMYESADDGSPELWARVVEMGRDLIPDHPLIGNADFPGDADGEK